MCQLNFGGTRKALPFHAKMVHNSIRDPNVTAS